MSLHSWFEQTGDMLAMCPDITTLKAGEDEGRMRSGWVNAGAFAVRMISAEPRMLAEYAARMARWQR